MKTEIKTKVYSAKGIKNGEVVLPASIFARELNRKVLSEVVVALQKNQRVSKANAKARSDVSGGGRKPWRQKGTGRARHGSIRSPIWRGGGVTHGPTKDRKYQAKVNTKVKQQSLAMALSEKLRADEVIVVDSLAIDEAKTKAIKTTVEALLAKRATGKTLLVLASRDEKIYRAAGNLPGVSVAEARNINVLDVLSAKYVVLEKEAVEILSKRAL